MLVDSAVLAIGELEISKPVIPIWEARQTIYKDIEQWLGRENKITGQNNLKANKLL